MNYSGGYDAEERGPLRAFFSRILENPDHPLGWSVRMFVLRGIDARIHLVTIIVGLALLLSSLAYDNFGFFYMLVVIVAGFVLVLIHEFGHAFSCRAVGGESDRIVMLPFGGLALTMPPPTWKANLITTIGGPAVHIPIFVVLAASLALAGHPEAILFNPLDPASMVAGIQSGSNVATYALSALALTHYVNGVLFLFNMILVFFPFDAGRIIQAVVWRSSNYRKATSFAVHFGLFGAVLLFVIALVFGNTILVAIAAFGGISCWSERQRLSAVDEITGLAPGEADAAFSYGGGLGGGAGGGLGARFTPDAEPDPSPSKKELREQQKEEDRQAELDRILAKIAEQGMDALTKRERKLLDSESQRRRAGT